MCRSIQRSNENVTDDDNDNDDDKNGWEDRPVETEDEGSDTEECKDGWIPTTPCGVLLVLVLGGGRTHSSRRSRTIFDPVLLLWD